MKKSGLYIHIPFCSSICGYCAFAVTKKGYDDYVIQQKYLEALQLELESQLKLCQIQNDFTTLYIGGGTPSSLGLKQIESLFEMLYQIFPDKKWEEITFEVNPEDIVKKPEMIQMLNSYKVSRLSLGVQTLSLNGLKVLERVSDENLIRSIMKEDINKFKGSLSLDFILAWPGQTINDLKKDLHFIEEFKPNHLSTYLLNYEPGTRLERDRLKGKINPLDDDLCADIWDHFQHSMAKLGYEHYEISNFAEKGHESIHNQNTWQGEEYLGIGAGAVSRIANTRWTNKKNPQQYIRVINNNENSRAEEELIDRDILSQEKLILELRHKSGLNLEEYENELNIPLAGVLEQEISRAVDKGDVLLERSSLKFTEKGWALFDDYLSLWMLKIEEYVNKDH